MAKSSPLFQRIIEHAAVHSPGDSRADCANSMDGLPHEDFAAASWHIAMPETEAAHHIRLSIVVDSKT